VRGGAACFERSRVTGRILDRPDERGVYGTWEGRRTGGFRVHLDALETR
jgi:hypothetical protein